MRKIELGYLKISPRAKRYIAEVLESNRLSSGPFTRRFERAFAAEHGCEEAILCNSGTSALQIAVAALKERHGWKDGDELLVPAVTFIATSNVVLQNRLVPVFVDVDPFTYNMDPGQVEKQLTPRTRAVVPVHLVGLPCDMEPLLSFAKKQGLQLLEDSCETMFVRYRGKPVGSFGTLACFSTYVAHLLVTGVGGLITTNDGELATLCRSILAHGRDPAYLSIDDDDRLENEAVRSRIIQSRFSFVRMGYSYRVTELEAALGLAALEEKEEAISLRRRNGLYLLEHLRPLEKYLQLPFIPSDREHAFMMFPLVLKEGIHREPLVSFLEANGVETRSLFPLLNQPFYRQLFGNLEERYPAAKRINSQGFYIGCHQGLSPEDLDDVARLFHDYFQRLC